MTEGTQLAQSVPAPDPFHLIVLAQITENKRLAIESWERAVAHAISMGFSERQIAKAAGISGPAVHARKRKTRRVPATCRGCGTEHQLIAGLSLPKWGCGTDGCS